VAAQPSFHLNCFPVSVMLLPMCSSYLQRLPLVSKGCRPQLACLPMIAATPPVCWKSFMRVCVCVCVCVC